MFSTPARYRFARTATAGRYLVERVGSDLIVEHLGTVARDGRAWVIVTTARGDLPGEPARYATRTDAVDALSAMLRAAARLDALPTDDEPADLVRPVVVGGTVRIDPRTPHTDEAHAAAIATAAAAAIVCPSCLYYSGHTSWCPRRPVEDVVEAPVERPAPGPALDRVTAPQDLDDRALWVQAMLEDREQSYGEPDNDRHAALFVEVELRFGSAAPELTADYATGMHMSSDDIVEWAWSEYPHLLSVATGAFVPEWRR